MQVLELVCCRRHASTIVGRVFQFFFAVIVALDLIYYFAFFQLIQFEDEPLS